MPFIIIDRDGVINDDSDEYIKSPDEWLAIPGSLEAIANLNRAGFDVFIATNQSGIARELYDLETLSLIHEKMISELASVGGFVREIFFCPHHPDENCDCRKPAPGLFYQIRDKFHVPLSQTYFIGDSWSDIQAANQAGCKPLLVLTGNGSKTLVHHPEIATSVPQFANLAAAAAFVIAEFAEQQHAEKKI